VQNNSDWVDYLNTVEAQRVPGLRAPFPWFGGKSRVTPLVWEAFGDVRNYVEPFFGSGAVLLGRPRVDGVETVNDLDGFVANFWRAVAADPDAVAEHADWPVNECDKAARHLWLVGHREDLPLRLMADPEFFDAKIAGWWAWGLCSWIGGYFCSGQGPWHNVDGRFTKTVSDGLGVIRQLPLLAAGVGVNRKNVDVREWFSALRDRLRGVRVACGDWQRVAGARIETHHSGFTGVFLDPPYSEGRAGYGVGNVNVGRSVREYAISAGESDRMRIALCGYEGEHAMPPDWQCIAWKSQGGRGSQADGEARVNATRERIWLSPACLPVSHEAHLNSAHTKQLTQIAKTHKTTADLRATMLQATKNLKRRSS